jgi:hypothetical protein
LLDQLLRLEKLDVRFNRGGRHSGWIRRYPAN